MGINCSSCHALQIGVGHIKKNHEPAARLSYCKKTRYSAFGYNIEAGKYLNFVSTDNPNVKKGDKVILNFKQVKSVLGSFIITYEKL